jgi:DNA-binding LacI/PurR family transcriptional regulator
VVCANDGLALDLWCLANEGGLRVPQDLSVTGMDNTSEGGHHGLTSVDGCFEDVGRAGVKALMAMLGGGSAEEASRVVPVQIVERSSVARPSVHHPPAPMTGVL